MKKSLALILGLSLTGCASVAQIGEIGTHKIYWVQTCDVIAPCTTTILTYNNKDGALNKIEGGTGPSVLGQLAGPASVATAGYFVGRGLEDSGDTITNTETTTTTLQSKSQSQGGASLSVSGAVSGSVAASQAGAIAGAAAQANGLGIGVGH